MNNLSIPIPKDIPSFNNNEPISLVLFVKSGWVAPPPKTKSPEARARQSQLKVNQLLNDALQICPANRDTIPVEVKILEEAIRISLEAYYDTKAYWDNIQGRHPQGTAEHGKNT